MCECGLNLNKNGKVTKIQEGSTSKGGTNPQPSTPRPAQAPIAQSPHAPVKKNTIKSILEAFHVYSLGLELELLRHLEKKITKCEERMKIEVIK